MYNGGKVFVIIFKYMYFFFMMILCKGDLIMLLNIIFEC